MAKEIPVPAGKDMTSPEATKRIQQRNNVGAACFARVNKSGDDNGARGKAHLEWHAQERKERGYSLGQG